MGSNTSKIFSIQNQAKGLGNPENPVFEALPRASPNSPPHHGLTVISCFKFGNMNFKTSGGTTFGYQMDPSRFESGYIIVVEYSRNTMELSCPENDILNFAWGMDPLYFNRTILGVLNLSSYITRISFFTRDGKPYFQEKGTMSVHDIPYNLIPSAINHIRVPISEIVLLSQFQSTRVHSEVVGYRGAIYMFKHYGMGLPTDWISFHDEVLEEIFFRSQISSPFILQPSFVVTDSQKSGRFRGFLVPFQPAGSFYDLFKRLKTEQSSGIREPDWNQLWTLDFGFFSPVFQQGNLSSLLPTLKISWKVKHLWAIEITSAVIAMHETGNFCGNLTLECILLCKDGHARLINIAPWRGYNLYFSPPEVDDGTNLETTGPRDIFSLGLILWAIAEEMAEFGRESLADIPVPSWKDDQNSAPHWFREMVASCIQRDPEDRPSATVIRGILTRKMPNSNTQII